MSRNDPGREQLSRNGTVHQLLAYSRHVSGKLLKDRAQDLFTIDFLAHSSPSKFYYINKGV